MYTETHQLDGFYPAYPLERLAAPEDILLLDIETTGFTAKSSSLYMIGCAYLEAGSFYVRQGMAETYEQEAEILKDFFEFASRFHHLIHFNGNNFDLPYLVQKCAQYGLPYNFDGFEGIDLYKRVAPYKNFLHLPNCKQKSIEQFLGLERDDQFSGGELIGVYHDYVQSPSDETKKNLLLHNREDVAGMLRVLPILSYCDLCSGEFRAKKVQANYYTDYAGEKKQELIMTLSLSNALPAPISVSANGCYLAADGDKANLRVPILDEELKYFYANYKDYYYLPEEDTALHKSVAGFVDKEHREQATAANCYTKKHSLYLPQWDILFKPFFKREYKSREIFFELTDEMKKDRQAFTDYARHILNMLNSIQS